MFAFAPIVNHKLGRELILFFGFVVLLENIVIIVHAQFETKAELQIHLVIFFLQ